MAAISLDAAAAAMRDTMRDTVRRNSLLYLLQGILMVITGVLALIYPSLASVAIVRLLGWFLIASGVFQGFGLIGAREDGVALSRTGNRHWRIAAAPHRRRPAVLQRALPYVF